ncbi:hypothetical protein SDC9_59591 [bioreactor metagenome]|uniref:Uncharacterized protein n=1 Tax=bioreactor metagenome TaxID=1076179 RepID=A0A644XAH8_9ZZZZ
MAFGDPHVEKSVREPGGKLVQPAAAFHGRSKADNPAVIFGHVEHDACGCLAPGPSHGCTAFFRPGGRNAVESGRILLSLFRPFSLDSHHVEKHRPVVFFCQLEDVLKFFRIVAVEGAPVVYVHLVENVDGLDDGLDMVFHLSQDILKSLPPGKRRAGILDGLLEPVVSGAGAQSGQVGCHASHPGADGHGVVVENINHFRP